MASRLDILFYNNKIIKQIVISETGISSRALVHFCFK
jgi:hypothetical protein